MNFSIPDLWHKMSGYPGGRWLFSVLIGRFVRYSGTVGARLHELTPGRSLLTMRDRPKVRNHLRSVHATALATFGELASGLAMMSGMPPGMRAIVTKLEIEYLKKARGTLTAHGEAPIPDAGESREYLVTASIRNTEDEEVAKVVVHWLVGPDEAKAGP